MLLVTNWNEKLLEGKQSIVENTKFNWSYSRARGARAEQNVANNKGGESGKVRNEECGGKLTTDGGLGREKLVRTTKSPISQQGLSPSGSGAIRDQLPPCETSVR